MCVARMPTPHGYGILHFYIFTWKQHVFLFSIHVLCIQPNITWTQTDDAKSRHACNANTEQVLLLHVMLLQMCMYVWSIWWLILFLSVTEMFRVKCKFVTFSLSLTGNAERWGANVNIQKFYVSQQAFIQRQSSFGCRLRDGYS